MQLWRFVMYNHDNYFIAPTVQCCFKTFLFQRRDYTALAQYLPDKTEYIVQVRLSSIQRDLYRLYLDTCTNRGANKQAVSFFLFFLVFCLNLLHDAGSRNDGNRTYPSKVSNAMDLNWMCNEPYMFSNSSKLHAFFLPLDNVDCPIDRCGQTVPPFMNAQA